MLHVPEWARRLLADVVTLWFCVRHPRSPLIVKILAGIIVAYALSPIDLIPDFIPVLGFADDAIAIVIALRFAIHSAGEPAIRRHWPGTPEGLESLLVLSTPRSRRPAEEDRACESGDPLQQ